MRNILFRADSSSTIGTGHIMRDLVLAEQFSGDNIIFATQDLLGNINHKIEEKKYTIEILYSNNLEELDTLIKQLKIDMIVIDHYGIDYNFEKQLKDHNPSLIIMSLDDTYERHYCDILLNHNISADSKKYTDLVPKNCELRCGAPYTLLRDEFLNIKKAKRVIEDKQPLTLFIAMGGADHSNKNIEILKVINMFKDLCAIVVTTQANQHLDELEQYVKQFNNIAVHINTTEIATLMNQSDLAIITPSVTVNEVINMGLPFIAIQTATNQVEIANFLILNDFQVIKEFDSHKLEKAISHLLNPSHYQDNIKMIEKILEDRVAS